MKLRPVSCGWQRSALFGIAALVVIVTGHGVIAKSSHGGEVFILTFLAITVLPALDEIRRRALVREPDLPRWLRVPPDATFEPVLSLRALAWPTALLAWVLLPAIALAGGINVIVGELVHDLPGSIGGALAAVAGSLAGLCAWMALRTVVTWRTAAALGRWPAYTEALPASLRFKPFLAEWRLDPVYYYEPFGRRPTRSMR